VNRELLATLFLGSFGTKVLVVLLLLMGLPMRTAAIIMVVIVVWRVIVLYRKGRGDDYMIDWKTHTKLIEKASQQWVWVYDTPAREEADGPEPDTGAGGPILTDHTTGAPEVHHDEPWLAGDAYTVGGPWLPRKRGDVRKFRGVTGGVGSRVRRGARVYRHRPPDA
jgi:hypothetical protein